LCVSTAGPFLVMAGMDAYAVVLWRMAFSSLLFFAWGALRGELRVPAGHLPRIIGGALLLALHFALWVKAFDLTDYASNLLLLVAQPVMAAVLEMQLGARHGRQIWVSIGLAVLGLTVIAGGDFTLGARALLGDVLCIVAGFAIASFYVVTRDARAATPLTTFMAITFAVGSLAMLPLIAVSGARLFGYAAASWGWLAALVAITTVAGHGLTNLAARHVRLFTLNIVIVLEPAIAIAMGAMMFGASVHGIALVGGVLLVASVIVGLRS
jgi:drug/metabolite transporter (DMT)-like permease